MIYSYILTWLIGFCGFYTYFQFILKPTHYLNIHNNNNMSNMFIHSFIFFSNSFSQFIWSIEKIVSWMYGGNHQLWHVYTKMFLNIVTPARNSNNRLSAHMLPFIVYFKNKTMQRRLSWKKKFTKNVPDNELNCTVLDSIFSSFESITFG